MLSALSEQLQSAPDTPSPAELGAVPGTLRGVDELLARIQSGIGEAVGPYGAVGGQKIEPG